LNEDDVDCYGWTIIRSECESGKRGLGLFIDLFLPAGDSLSKRIQMGSLLKGCNDMV